MSASKEPPASAPKLPGEEAALYRWREGFYGAAGVPAAAAAGALHALAQRLGHDPSTEEILEDAVSTTHPLHRMLEWNNDAAAHEWRKAQVRQIVGAIVKVAFVGGTQVETRAFHSVNRDETRGRGYADVATVILRSDLRHQILGETLRSIAGLKAKLQTFDDLLEAVEAVSEAEAKVKNVLDNRKRPKRPPDDQPSALL